MEERYRLLYDALRVGVTVHVEGRMVYANEAAAAIFGVARETMVERAAAAHGATALGLTGELLSPQELPAARAAAGQNVAGEAIRLEIPGREPVWISVTSTSVREPPGNVIVVSTIEDLSRGRQPYRPEIVDPQTMAEFLTPGLAEAAAILVQLPESLLLGVAGTSAADPAVAGELQRVAAEAPSVSLRSRLLLQVMRSRRPLLLDGPASLELAGTASPRWREVIRAVAPGSLAILPLGEPESWGLAALARGGERPPLTEGDLKAAQARLAPLGEAIGRDRNAAAAARRLRRILALLQLEDQLAAAGSLEDLAAAGLDLLASELEAHAGEVWLSDGGGRLKRGAARGFRLGSLGTSERRVGEGVTGRIAADRRPVLISDLERTGRHVVRAELIKTERLRSYSGFPILSSGQCLGVIGLFHREQVVPDQEWTAFARLVASRLASALLPARRLPASAGGPMASPLTQSELRVLTLLSEGLANSEVAARLHLSENTVKFHAGNIYRKLGVRNRLEAARSAAARGLLQPAP